MPTSNENTTTLPPLADDAELLARARRPRSTAWKSRGNCHQSNDFATFFPARGVLTEEIVAEVCASCPVRMQCLQLGIQNASLPGLWGGRSSRQRRELATLIADINRPQL